jgi:peptide/nickel transport system ATP-binding protein/oligopeptide transport system ATP-binding protein
MVSSEPLLDIKHLKTYFHTYEGTAKAVDDVSFSLGRGEILGVAGESGCGKSVTAQSIIRLIPEPPGQIVGGEIVFDGRNLAGLPKSQVRSICGKRISMIFQEPMTSLNPVYTIGRQIAEMFGIHQNLKFRDSWDRSVEMLKKVQIPEPKRRAGEYPHQLSGGMRQRAMIAMALACNPEILIADEPTTALDVTVQAEILDLMRQLKEDYQTAIMLITHDLGVIAEITSRVVIMYAGKIVERADTESIFENPLHPYTQGLLRSIPRLGQRAKHGDRQLREIKGMVPGLTELPAGCAFSPRCSETMSVCRSRMPDLAEAAPDHDVRCWLYAGDRAKEV